MGKWAKQARLSLSQGDFIQAGDFFKLDGDIRGAIQAYTDGKHFTEAAKLYESLGKTDKAEKLLLKYASPKDKAEFYLRNDQPERAVEVYLSNGQNFEAAELLEKLNQLARAAALFESLGFLEKAGVLYGKCHFFDRAINVLTRQIEQLDANEGALTKGKILKYQLWIANFHIGAKRFIKAGEFFEAAQQLEKAAKCYLKGGDAMRGASMLIHINMLDEAISILNRVNSLESRILQGRIAFQRSEWERAAELLENTPEHAMLSEAYEQLGRFQDAAALMEKTGNTQAAAQLFEKAGDHRRAAILFEQHGMFADAARNYEAQEKWANAAKLYHHARNRYKAGYCLFKINRYDDALAQLQTVTEDDANITQTRHMMAEIFFHQGVYSVARQLYEDLLGQSMITDETMPGFYFFARCCEEEGQLDEAKRIYERIFARRANFGDVTARLRKLQSVRISESPPMNAARNIAVPSELAVGDLIDSRFKVIDTIGKGGMGAIFKVKDTALNRNIALKMLTHKRGDFEELKVELLIARDLTHPYIIKVFDVGSWHGMGYFTMEAVEGEPLKNYIHNSQDDLATKVRLIIKICEGLKHAHEQNVVHRDIKPQNIMIDRNMNPKILDFGIARKTTHDPQGKPISGSPKYMAPEQIQNTKTDVRTDVYAMGIIMFYMFTLKEPFLAKTPQQVMRMHLEDPLPEPMQVNPEMPYWLSEIIQKCCRKEPMMRFSNMGELIDELKLNLLDF